MERSEALATETNVKSRIGFVGIGNMGRPMALRLLSADHELVVCDMNAAATVGLVASGARVANTPEEVANEAETVFVSLPSPEVAKAVALGRDGLCHGRAIKRYVDMSTTGAGAASAIASALLEHGVSSVDAPVSGGVRGAEAGTLAIMVAASDADYKMLLPLLEILGNKVFHVGTIVGQAQTVKVLNNLLAATAMIASSEAIVMGVKAGLDARVLLDVINSGSGRNMATAEKFPRVVLPRTFNNGFRTQLMCKDVKLCLEEAERLGATMWVGGVVRQVCGFAASQAKPDEDFTEIIKHFERWADAEVHG